jgi:glyoxylase-like metal-dependent hydrolase (beta-lactamase superfamily II)
MVPAAPPAEEVISYLIVGKQRALLFDTGMGMSDIKKLTAELTRLPIIVLNSHTHDDHVGGNWQFKTIYGIDTELTRKNARSSREDAQAEITPDQICGALPKGFDPKTYATRPWEITAYTRLVAAFDAVRAGRVPAVPESRGKVLYKVGDISFLMRAKTP